MGLLEQIWDSSSDRGVSPVIGVILMVAVAVVIAAAIGATALGVTDDVSDPAPQAQFDIEETDSGIKITHESGDSIDGDEIKLKGAATEDTIPDWEGETVESGDSATVQTEEGELDVVVESEGGSDTYELASSEVPNTLISISGSINTGPLDNDCTIPITVDSLENTDEVTAYSPYDGQSSADEDSVEISEGDTETLDGGCGFAYNNGQAETVYIYESSEQKNEITVINFNANSGTKNFDSE